jgi:hypothetical protein
MGQLVLLVVAAAWAAVLVPPLLRSRVENRPNSSVTDFRRQLNRLQSTVPARAGGGMRPLGRQLAPSPLQRPAAAGRPGDLHRRSGTRHTTGRASPPPNRVTAGRVHADPAQAAALRHRVHSDDGRHGGVHHRQAHVARPAASHDVRRRRSNVLFVLVLSAASTLFLAATTKATVMLYLFALSFLALCGYVYLLAQIRQREQQAWPSSWPHEQPRR